MSHPTFLSGGDTRSVLVTTLGSDFQHAVAPFKAGILDVAQYLRGDLHRAAMRLLVDFNGRRPSAMEQQLIIAALAELQGDPPVAVADPLGRATTRIRQHSGDRSQLAAL